MRGFLDRMESAHWRWHSRSFRRLKNESKKKVEKRNNEIEEDLVGSRRSFRGPPWRPPGGSHPTHRSRNSIFWFRGREFKKEGDEAPLPLSLTFCCRNYRSYPQTQDHLNGPSGIERVYGSGEA